MPTGTWTITTANSTTNWQAAGGWTSEPNNGGTAIINQGKSTYTIVYDATGGFATIGALIVDSANAKLEFNQSGFALNVTQNNSANNSANNLRGNGLTTLTAGTIAISNNATLATINLNATGGTFTESGGTLTVTNAANFSGTSATFSGGNFNGGGSLTVSGGTFNQSGGTITVNAANFTGGTDTLGGTFNASKTLSVGTANGAAQTLTIAGGTTTITGVTTIESASTSGGSEIALSGGNLVGTGGITFGKAGGVDFAGTLDGFGTVTGTFSGGGVVEATGGTLELKTNIAASAGPSFDIGTGATDTLQVDGTVGTGDTFAFLSTSSGELALGKDTSFSGTISGLDEGASTSTPTSFIDIVGNSSVTVTSNLTGTGTSTVLGLSDGATLSLTNINLTSSTWYANWKTVGSDTEIFLSDDPCYAAGTHILTASGERTVESLMAGDIVLTLTDGELGAQPVKWLGRRRIDLAAHPRPETVAPIRIRRGAFADDMPHSDLLVSPDHAILVDGKLICARQLVNGTTILQESGGSAIEYFHVELESHAILLAEGLPAESYLNTGNHGFFANAGAPLVLHPDLTDETDYPTREAGSCAPFVSDETSVRPVWQRLAERAAALGQPAPQRDTTADPALRIVAKGRTLRPLYAENGLHIFALPKGATEVRVVSRAGAPTDARPWLEDRRRLGVYVERIALRGASEVHEVPMDHPELADGWWAVERRGTAMRRWTNGDAALPLPGVHGPAMLEIRVSGGMTYVADVEEGRHAALA